ncbi:hypothetical protein [Mucilaginibacter lappiensis]|uniref:Uncharacterized protein n=1 Tax=Mucilaginibacter lappiensis TaxID=354630 RepID=A0A1N6Y5Q2_9SPHI|nr:hypothetical protein [Mucilaginibacter lappiensis]MBB6109626.1 hypothetical protein [Mucilaginibacter lappiensis]MBB6128929.1 hypothetical protein [Mucilaginibacter lappiensis]SIR09874.1 hypothetical protein SAMN05421821_10542 [Mucilaginibacter lappiensis]
MINKTLLAVAVVLALSSCGNSQKKEEEKSGFEKLAEGAGNLSKFAKSGEKLKEQTEKLKKLTPATTEELKAVVPENVGDFKRKSYSAGGTVADIVAADAEYSKEDNKTIHVSILDGAGESGSAVVSLLAMGLSMQTEAESNGTVSKNIDVDGVRYSTEDTKNGTTVSSSLKFIYKERYAVTLEGQGYSLSDLQDFLKKLDLSSLK